MVKKKSVAKTFFPHFSSIRFKDSLEKPSFEKVEKVRFWHEADETVQPIHLRKKINTLTHQLASK